MARRGSEYRRKHFVEKIDKKAQEEREIVEKPYKAVLYHDEGYIDDFYNLSIEDAGWAYQQLAKSAKDDSEDACKLDEVLAAAGLKVAEHDGRFLHKQEVLTIRMDFYGTIDRIKDGLRERELSSYYRHLITNPLKKRPKSVQYDFETSPSWKLFSRFQSFRRIEKNLRAYLIKNKIDPQILGLMTPRDFSDLVVQSFQKDDNEQKITFETDITVRNEFVRDLAQKQGDQMADMLLKQGLDERYVASMINMMHRYGKYNSAKLVITEKNFTSRVLSELKKAEKALFAEISAEEFSKLKTEERNKLKTLFVEISRANAQKFKAGDVIPQTLIDAAIDADRGKLLLARYEDGTPLNGIDFPSFEVHHKHAVSDAGSLRNVAHVNYKKNFCLVRADIHTLFIHRCDKVRQRGQTKSYAKRLEFVDPNTAFMIGLRPDERMSFDFEKSKRTKRQTLDDRYNVSYEECMRQLALNQAAYDREHNKKAFDAKEDLQRYKSFRRLKKAHKMSLKAHTR